MERFPQLSQVIILIKSVTRKVEAGAFTSMPMFKIPLICVLGWRLLSDPSHPIKT